MRNVKAAGSALVGALALVLVLAGSQVADAASSRHGLSAFGDLKYAPEFTHFDYVNPDAPKGGRISMIGTAGRITFDSFNAFILKGDAAQGLEYLFDSLMVRAFDEPDAVYGLIALDAEVAADGRSVAFHLRPEAKFADGTPVTSDDIVFSFKALKEKGHPSFNLSLRDVVDATANGPHEVRYTFKGDLIRDLPVTVATLPVLSKAYYTTHAFAETSLEPPLGSGPYAISDWRPGTHVTYKRRGDYWARDLPVNRGRFNFDELRYEYYRDRTAELQSLLAGAFDFREEFTSLNWATSYNVAAVNEGRLVRLTLPDDRPSGAQGFFINTRKEKFRDARVRKALDLAFDFEWTNKNMFFELYRRTTSFFENSDMKASGRPGPEEMRLLEPLASKLSPEIMGHPYEPPVSDGTGIGRDRLKEAQQLLAEAGWRLQQEKVDDPNCGMGCRVLMAIGLKSARTEAFLMNAQGERLEVEFLIFEPTFEKIIGPYGRNLAQIGIKATIRRVDPAQYERRVKSFDFDLTTQRYSLSLTPGVELRSYWGSDAARTDGSFNLAGISDPVVDQLIERVMAAKSRPELLAATRAIDRVLRAGHYWVPHWYKASHNLAFWDKFSRPEVKPKYDAGVIDTWWYDAEKAAKLKMH